MLFLGERSDLAQSGGTWTISRQTFSDAHVSEMNISP